LKLLRARGTSSRMTLFCACVTTFWSQLLLAHLPTLHHPKECQFQVHKIHGLHIVSCLPITYGVRSYPGIRFRVFGFTTKAIVMLWSC
jgi:hypothetical protein